MSSSTTSESGYEYCDHPADIQLHSWGHSLESAFDSVGQALMNYSSNLDRVDPDPEQTQEFDVQGFDMENMLYRFLEEILFLFQTDHFITKKAKITNLDCDNFRVTGVLEGEVFNPKKHEKGADIKAITYSAMRIEQVENVYHIYVIVDI
ncbi:hypothetical protein GEMRC1_008300 [Eukaryota sp. GEM-RC1]